jgi:hypothetical protein
MGSPGDGVPTVMSVPFEEATGNIKMYHVMLPKCNVSKSLLFRCVFKGLFY